MNYNKFSKIASLFASGFLFFAPSAGAMVESDRAQQTALQPHSIEIPIEVAQDAYCLDNYRGDNLRFFVETENFYIYICGNSDDMYYHGVGKDGSEIILEDVYVEEGTGYVAINGDYTYIVNGAALSIYEGRILIQEDEVYQN